MNEPENFLTRWSRRKQDAEHTADEPGVAPASQIEADTPAEISAEAAGEKKEPEFDLSTLPPIESIDIGTDIRSFLQKGVPLELTRAALRRAWVADPAIRDFIGVAENQWDFAAGDIPGFGPLEPSDDVRRMVAEVFQEKLKPPVEQPEIANLDSPQQIGMQATAAPENSERAPQETMPSDTDEQKLLTPISSSDHEILPHREQNFATQQNAENSSDAQPGKRTHGGALPQ